MAGRVFRKHPPVPVKQIVQCKQTRHPMVKTATAEQQFVWAADRWRTLNVNRRIDEITEMSRQLIAQSKVELPKIVAAHRPRPLPRERGRFVDEG